jgi:diguanylate cyclase (GGDEF)-like protein
MNRRRLSSLAFLCLCALIVVLAIVAIRDGRNPGAAIIAAVLTGALLFVVSRQQRRLSGLAWTDPLTDLVNHRGFHERLVLELAKARREHDPVGLVVLDLDNFKLVNDRHGHPQGDLVLKEVGSALKATVREGDEAARTGGEEFALILPQTTAETALAVADRAREKIAAVEVEGIQLSCSAGVASYPSDASDAARLFQFADGALYWAKRSGKALTRRFDPLHVSTRDIAQQRAEMEAVLEHVGIVAAFQPVVTLATGRLVGYEALARFPGSSRPPLAWFSEGHAIGLGARLEAEAIRSALEPLGRPPGTHLALNVSPSALLSDEVRAALPKDLSDLVVEISEHERIADRPDLIDELNALRQRGALVAIDDAGAGYSGLKAVTDVRPDIVKLDRGLIAGIAGDPARLALVESFVRFAARIDATVCAEGVESPEDLIAIADLDVGWAQGYAVGAPAAPWSPVEPIAAELCRSAAAEALQATPRGGWARIGAGDRLLENLSARLASARTRGDLRDTLGLIAAALNADVVSVSRWRPELGTIETLAENAVEPPNESFQVRRFPLTARILRERIATQVLVGDPAADAREVELLLQLGQRSMLMVPVVHGGVSRGVIEATSRQERAWTRTEINRARIIANQFASVIESLDDEATRGPVERGTSAAD